jgi:hypothetical protein
MLIIGLLFQVLSYYNGAKYLTNWNFLTCWSLYQMKYRDDLSCGKYFFYYSRIIVFTWLYDISTSIHWLIWRKPEYPGKTTDLSQVTDKFLSHNVVSSTSRHGRGSNSQLYLRWGLIVQASHSTLTIILAFIFRTILFNIKWVNVCLLKCHTIM